LTVAETTYWRLYLKIIIVIDVSKEKLDICAGKKHGQSPNLGD